jgi:hypothetical protein
LIWRYYYYAGSLRLAMREVTATTNQWYYLFGDHLGSTAKVVSITDEQSSEVAEIRYKPWGETRYSNGSMPTDYTFTGQMSDSNINL